MFPQTVYRHKCLCIVQNVTVQTLRWCQDAQNQHALTVGLASVVKKMLLWLLTGLDTFVLLVTLSTQLDLVVKVSFLLFGTIYLVIKSVLFWGGVISYMDLGIALYLLLMIGGLRSFISWVIMLYLGQKIVLVFLAK